MTQEGPSEAANAAPVAAGHDPERERLAGILLEHCWQIVSEGLLSRMGEVFNDAVSAAARSGDETQVHCARTVALQVKTLVHAYRGALRTKFDEATASLLGKRPAQATPASGLSLVEMDESDLANQLGQLTARLRNMVRVPFAGLMQRLQALTGSERELQEAEAPLRPGVFLESMSETLASVITGHGDLAALLRHVPAAIEPPLSATYEALNRFLDSKGVVPATVVHRTPVKRAAPPPTIHADLPAALEVVSDGAQAPAARAPAPRAHGLPAPARHEASALAEEQLMVEYSRLQALVGVNASSLVEAAISAAHAVASGREPPTVPASSRLLTAMLTAQRQDAEFLAAKQRKAEPGKEAQQDLGKRPPSTRDYSLQLVGLATTSVHKLTIQLVARLFTRIERDRLVPAPVRALLTFLRFPLLEVALVDPSLFVRSERPARRLIDAIGSSSLGWTPEGTANRRYLQHARAAVQYILHSPGEALSAFAQAAEQFSTFLAAEPTQDGDRLNGAKDALQLAEEREIQAGAVSAFLAEILEGAHLEPYLRTFLLRVWARVLVEAFAREGQHPGLARRLLGAVPDLVWSVQPLVNAADRKRLVDTIPTVLGSLRDGLRLIDWPDAKLHELLNRLMAAHSHALKGSEPSAPGPSFSISTVRIRLDGFRIEEVLGAPREGPIDVLEEAVHQVLAAGASGVSHQWIGADTVPAFGPIDAIQAEKLIASWRDRTWFDLRIGHSPTRVRLEWTTPGRSLTLFWAPAGDALYSLSRESLLTYLRCSWITPVEPAPLVERAMRTVLSDLERASEAAADGGNG